MPLGNCVRSAKARGWEIVAEYVLTQLPDAFFESHATSWRGEDDAS